MIVRTEFIMLKHDVTPKDILQMQAILHKLRLQKTSTSFLQSNILMALIDNRKDKDNFPGVKADEYIHIDTEQYVLHKETIQAWNDIVRTLQIATPNAILTDC